MKIKNVQKGHLTAGEHNLFFIEMHFRRINLFHLFDMSYLWHGVQSVKRPAEIL